MECELENIKIYYEIYREGYPVLMIHGWTPDHRILKGCIEPIFKTRANYKRIYFDLPGMGKTKAEKWINSTDDFLKVTSDFIEKVIPDQKFIIVSNSYGCYLARGLIQKKVDFIDGVLFICPVIFADRNKRTLPKHIVIVEDPKLISDLNPTEAELFKKSTVVQSQLILERIREEILSGINIADFRRQGIASSMLIKLRDNWVVSNGVKTIWLQVEKVNIEAMELYHKLGMTKLYDYYYMKIF